MADPSSKPDQHAPAEGMTPEDAAARLNEILSSPIENPFAPDAKPVPSDFAAWTGVEAASAPETGPDGTEAPAPEILPEPTEPPAAERQLEALLGEPIAAPETAPSFDVPPSPLAEPAAGRTQGLHAGEMAPDAVVPAIEPVPAPPPARPEPKPAGADAGAAPVIAKVRRLMLISTVLTAFAIAAVFSIIGYRVFHGQGSQEAPTQATLTLPPGAKIVQTAIADDRIVLTFQLGGALEIRTYDLKTLKPLGRLNFSTVP